jgi:hypothetical protein
MLRNMFMPSASCGEAMQDSKWRGRKAGSAPQHGAIYIRDKIEILSARRLFSART